MRSLAAEGTTILLTTHYLDEAEHLADRVGVIARGRVVEVSTPATLGGRLQATATVRWSDADGRHEERTATPTALVADLVLRHPGEEVADLEVLRPTLEDTYLAMVGEEAR